MSAYLCWCWWGSLNLSETPEKFEFLTLFCRHQDLGHRCGDTSVTFSRFRPHSPLWNIKGSYTFHWCKLTEEREAKSLLNPFEQQKTSRKKEILLSSFPSNITAENLQKEPFFSTTMFRNLLAEKCRVSQKFPKCNLAISLCSSKFMQRKVLHYSWI